MPTLENAVDVLSLFADPTRVRLMALLSSHELTVAEITGVTELAQSRVSTHLGKLREAGVLRDRRVGTSTFYSVNDGAMPGEARKIWSVLEGELRDAVLEGDRARCEAMLRARERQGAWPDAVAGQMERHYSPGRTWEATARGLIGLIDLGEVLDVGSGDGTIAQLLAPRAKSFTCLDQSEKVLDAARERLAAQKNVRFRQGDMHALPFEAHAFDQVLLFNSLACAGQPRRAVAEAARVLRRGGRLAIITLDAHHHGDVTGAYGHVQPGFTPAALEKLLAAAGLRARGCEVTSREKRAPYFQVVTAFADKP